MGFKQSGVIGVNIRFIGSKGAGELQKKIVPPSNIVNKRGEDNMKVSAQQMKPWWHAVQIACLGQGQQPTDSSVDSVPV
jgi:hypothetical protein